MRKTLRRRPLPADQSRQAGNGQGEQAATWRHREQTPNPPERQRLEEHLLLHLLVQEHQRQVKLHNSVLSFVDLYPLISEYLLTKALAFAKKHVTFPDEHMEIILHCRTSLLFELENAWMKRKIKEKEL